MLPVFSAKMTRNAAGYTHVSVDGKGDCLRVLKFLLERPVGMPLVRGHQYSAFCIAVGIVTAGNGLVHVN